MYLKENHTRLHDNAQLVNTVYSENHMENIVTNGILRGYNIKFQLKVDKI